MIQKPLEFDYQSTTPCHPEVISAMDPYWLEHWGNPSNKQNKLGAYASAALSVARDQIALQFKVDPDRVIFTSGATEANNLALLGSARANALRTGRKGHLITLTTEHHAVLDPLRQLEKEGFRLTELSPSQDGLICLDKISDAFKDDTILVSIMMANNEIGVIQPISDISRLCKERGIIFHSDVVQACGNIPLLNNDIEIDMLTISAHKIYGPKGIGALINSSAIPLVPLLWGGSQENQLRPGTIALPLVIGFAKAIEISQIGIDENLSRIRNLQTKLLRGLCLNIQGLKINGSMDDRLANNLNLTIPGVLGNRLFSRLRPLINCSSASACMNGEPSHVLLSLGRSIDEAKSSIRLSIGRLTTEDDVMQAIEYLTEIVNQLRIGK